MGAQKIVPNNKEEKKKIVVMWQVSQVNNKPPCVLFKGTSYAAEKKWLLLKKVGQTPSWKRPEIYSGYKKKYLRLLILFYFSKLDYKSDGSYNYSEEW